MKRILLASALIQSASLSYAEPTFPEADQFIDCANVYTFYRREAPANQYEPLDAVIGLSSALAEVTSSSSYVEKRRTEMLNEEYRKQDQAQKSGTFDFYRGIFNMKLETCKSILKDGRSKHQAELDALLKQSK